MSKRKSKKPRQVKLYKTRYLARKAAKQSKSTKPFKTLKIGENKFATVRKGSAFY